MVQAIEKLNLVEDIKVGGLYTLYNKIKTITLDSFIEKNFTKIITKDQSIKGLLKELIKSNTFFILL